jgi:hypothetical protein
MISYMNIESDVLDVMDPALDCSSALRNLFTWCGRSFSGVPILTKSGVCVFLVLTLLAILPLSLGPGCLLPGFIEAVVPAGYRVAVSRCRQVDCEMLYPVSRRSW